MSELVKLQVRHLRNLKDVAIQPCPRVNIFFGENGSGKTSVLEAIHMLSLGRSFRSRLAAPVISLGAPELVVYGKVASPNRPAHAIGLSKSRDGGTQARIDGRNSLVLAELSKLLPLIVVVPESFELLTGGPGERRQFLDWGVFHVEHTFIDSWRAYQRALKQRNALLRRGRIDGAQMAVWNDHLVHHAQIIDALRVKYLDRLVLLVKDMLARFDASIADISLLYQRGWPKGRELASLLHEYLDRDIAMGRTSVGPHKADIKVSIHGLDARDHLSRGQQKIVVCAMKLAQGMFFRQQTGNSSVYLVDDLLAELDAQNAKKFCQLLEELEAQVFITALDLASLQNQWSRHIPISTFHVEHGEVKQFAPT